MHSWNIHMKYLFLLLHEFYKIFLIWIMSDSASGRLKKSSPIYFFYIIFSVWKSSIYDIINRKKIIWLKLTQKCTYNNLWWYMFFLSTIRSARRHCIAHVCTMRIHTHVVCKKRNYYILGQLSQLRMCKPGFSRPSERVRETYGWNYGNWPACHASECYNGVQSCRWQVRWGPERWKTPRSKKAMYIGTTPGIICHFGTIMPAENAEPCFTDVYLNDFTGD